MGASNVNIISEIAATNNMSPLVRYYNILVVKRIFKDKKRPAYTHTRDAMIIKQNDEKEKNALKL